MEYSMRENPAHNEKSKPVIVLQKIAWVYFILSTAFIFLSVSGIHLTSIDFMLFVGFLLAGFQTLFIAAVVQSVYKHKKASIS